MTGLAPPTPYQWSVGDVESAALLNAQLYTGLTFLLNPPMWHVTQSSAQTFATSGTAATMQYNTTVSDTYGGWNGSTFQYTVQQAGWYWVSAAIHWAANTTGYRYTDILKNGSANLIALLPPATSTTTTAISGPILCAAGDVLSVQGLQTSGGSLATMTTGGFTPFFSGFFMHL